MIFADVVRQYTIQASTGNELGVTVGHPMTHRMAVLRGRTTDLPYLYAESTFLPSDFRNGHEPSSNGPTSRSAAF